MIEVIVRYNGEIYKIGEELGAIIEVLFYGYAIITIEENKIPLLYNYSEIEYIEMPKLLELTGVIERRGICLYDSTECGFNIDNECLSGEGIIIGIIDSGIDYRNNEFIDTNGRSRILFIYDLSDVVQNKKGTEYTREQINNALMTNSQLGTFDYIGHGTAVATIACGNRDGIAVKSDIISVKLGENTTSEFARSTDIMRGIKYIIDKAINLNKPVCINLSYGTNYGSHNGNSIFEQFIDTATGVWKNVICVPTGNEGNRGKHFSDIATENSIIKAEFVIGNNTTYSTIVIYKDFSDEIEIEIISPNGESTGFISQRIKGTSRYSIETTNISVVFTQPSPYNLESDFFIELSGNITVGIWAINIRGINIVNGRFDMWLPVTETSGNARFLKPSPEFTLTIPSTAKNVITVGGIDSKTRATAVFSGRGFINGNIIKPDVVAPAVDVLVGLSQFTGTSFASPFVTGVSALIMEWGIIKRNDLNLYGQRIKAFLRLGAERNEGINYPNTNTGFGILCVENTIKRLKEYTD